MNTATRRYGPFETLRAGIDHVLDPAYNRDENIHVFFRTLYFGRVTVKDWEEVVARMPNGSAYQSGENLPNTRGLLLALSDEEKTRLKEYYFVKLTAIVEEFPKLKDEFPEQFR